VLDHSIVSIASSPAEYSSTR